MAQEPDNLILHHLRELRETMERRFDTLGTEMAELRAEMREARSALVAIAHLVTCSVAT